MSHHHVRWISLAIVLAIVLATAVFSWWYARRREADSAALAFDQHPARSSVSSVMPIHDRQVPLLPANDVWLLHWGIRLEMCEVFLTRSGALAFQRDELKGDGVIDWRRVRP